MPLLSEVLALVNRYHAGTMLNVETKVEAGAPAETAPREQFVQVTAAEIRRSGLLRQVTIQSFDWGSLIRMRQVEPRLPLVALTNYDFLQTLIWLSWASCRIRVPSRNRRNTRMARSRAGMAQVPARGPGRRHSAVSSSVRKLTVCSHAGTTTVHVTLIIDAGPL
jgi:glycerophosphoryl diester phosphodiesterase